MPVQNDALLSPLNIESMPACDESLELALRFLKAAGECVNTLVTAELARAAMIFFGPITQW
jgi:hypothetical protein